MSDASTQFHEPLDRLQESTLETHRGLASLIEELEAIDWYQQRIDATTDEQLKRLLVHNRDEEKEHAAMALEWLRRRDPAFDRILRIYLFSEGDIDDLEEEHGTGAGDSPARGGTGGDDGSLGVGSLKEVTS